MLNILLVDDEDIDRLAVRQALNATGLSVNCVEACDYHSAIAQINHETFDCVFLDYCLPDKDGLSLVQDLRNAGVKIPLVVITAHGNEQVAVALMKAGASDYLVKDKVSPTSLERIVQNATRIYQAERQVELAHQQLRQTNEQLIRQNQELAQQRQQIQHQNLQLKELSKLKSQFLATTSHELRTPMNVIIGFAQMLLLQRHGSLTPSQVKMVQCILKNGKHLLSLLSEVLDFAQIEAGSLELKAEEFNVDQVVNSTVNNIRPLALQKGLDLSVTIQLKNPSVINDRSRLHKVLEHLLMNAVKFTKSGSIWVNVYEIELQRLVIEVEDTGIGLSQAELDYIFEAFRQVDQTIARQYDGTGLGLAMTKSLVQLMQGNITVESQVGEGSIFRVELPRYLAYSGKLTEIKMPAYN
ncbi:ATP-binding response regulator [Coleofasciculus sp. C1-SOL-03]|uniref:ATP-binding response regulator n=1 Tax=Coleofasciculus sp. C1-SOL-03 TaxID=3069522 RepID=UPI0040631D79